ncbi:membrane protein [Arthrobacter sp. ZBG10]|uniref:hypothetical protein n=1 Tax=Arthrobacter sp. ZBG10 TaxID=1676590 RepID=UPI00067FAFEA|nr:hypothetical protein [Arthrobacter sp. ZBG10]KNH15364.1 membrane protein [Arthrobacter sp. ZBG10]
MSSPQEPNQSGPSGSEPRQPDVPGQPPVPPPPPAFGPGPYPAQPGQEQPFGTGVPGQQQPGQHAQNQYAQNPYAQAGPTPFGLPGEAPRPKRRRTLWIILAAVGGFLVLVAIGVIVLINVVGGATNQAKGLADGFTDLVIAGDTSSAYDDYLDPALQKQISKESFIAGIESLDMDASCKPDYNSVNVATENGSKSADIAGVIACDGGNVDLAYHFEGTDQLKMTNIKLRPAG